MKILHVVQAVSRNFGGVQTVLHDLVRAQAEAGHSVDVISTNVDTPDGVLPMMPNVFIENDGVRWQLCSVEIRSLLVSRNLRNYIKDYIDRYDIVHIHGLYRFPPTYAAWQARRQSVPYVIGPHGSLDPYIYDKSSRRTLRLKRLYERGFDLPNLHAAGAIHYTTEEERKRASFLGLKASSFVVPNGLDWEQYQVLPARGALRARLSLGDAPVVLFMGRLHPVKGLDLLIPAFDALRRRVPDVQLVIAGPENDGYGLKVRNWVLERKLNDTVHFVGSLHGSDVVQAYVDADVFVLPSYTENFGMTVAEAMACALPVVISDQVKIHGEVSEAKSGLVTRCDVDEVVEALAALLHDPDQRRVMGEAGRRLVQARYTWPIIVEALTDEYQKVIDRHQHGGKGALRSAGGEPL